MYLLDFSLMYKLFDLQIIVIFQNIDLKFKFAANYNRDVHK